MGALQYLSPLLHHYCGTGGTGESDRMGALQYLSPLLHHYTILQTTFPDLQITIEDQVAEGDKVTTRYTIRGTHQGEFMGIAATGKPVTWTALVLQRVVSGKIQESWLQWDQLGLTQQLGVVPPPGGSRG